MITASSSEIQEARRGRVLNFQQITMPYLAAFVPAHWIVRHVDEALSRWILTGPQIWWQSLFIRPSAPHVMPWRSLPPAGHNGGLGRTACHLAARGSASPRGCHLHRGGRTTLAGIPAEFEAGHHRRRLLPRRRRRCSIPCPWPARICFIAGTTRPGSCSPRAAVLIGAIFAWWPIMYQSRRASGRWQAVAAGIRLISR